MVHETSGFASPARTGFALFSGIDRGMIGSSSGRLSG
jgi:hypothetical protein